MVVEPAFQYIALVLKGERSLDIAGGVQKRVDAPHQWKSQKSSLRLEALTRVTSEPNLKINGAV